MGGPAGWMTTLTGRPAMRSPGRPPIRRDVERAFWVKIAEGLTSEDAAVAEQSINACYIADWGYFYGPRWGFYWPFLGPYDEYYYTEGTLVLDFVDSRTKELVWRGVADKALYNNYYNSANYTFSDKDLLKILDKMLTQYPPTRLAYREK